MSTHTRAAAGAVTRALRAAAVAVALAPRAFGCSSGPEPASVAPAEAGSLRLSLTGVSSSGLAYRLRSGTFTIRGQASGASSVVSTEAQPDGAALRVELPPDTYEVFLEPGHFLELLPAGARVAARLVSANPSLVSLQPGGVSTLSFTFQVEGEQVELEGGVLELGVEVIDDAPSCAPDPFEPNDEPASAAELTPGEPIAATLCPFDLDHYRFPSPVAAAEAFTVTLRFESGRGDVEAVLLEADTGVAVAFGFGGADVERLTALSSGGDYLLQVFLAFDASGGESPYTIELGGGSLSGASRSCCEARPEPGCDQPELLACVCAADSFCCQVEFDATCTSAALACGARCTPPGAKSGCCSASAAPGCTLPAVQACVCAIDPSCCASSFDGTCAALAAGPCGAECPAAGG